MVQRKAILSRDTTGKTKKKKKKNKKSLKRGKRVGDDGGTLG